MVSRELPPSTLGGSRARTEFHLYDVRNIDKSGMAIRSRHLIPKGISSWHQNCF